MLLWKDWFIWLNQFKINYSLTYVATVWKDQCISVNQFVLNYLYVVMESLMTKWLTLSNMLLWESNFNLVIESVHTKQLFLIHAKSFLWLNHAKRLSLSYICWHGKMVAMVGTKWLSNTYWNGMSDSFCWFDSL